MARFKITGEKTEWIEEEIEAESEDAAMDKFEELYGEYTISSVYDSERDVETCY